MGPSDFNKVYCENCLKTMARMEAGQVDLCLTSPPYNMRLRVRDGKYVENERADGFSSKYLDFGDDMPVEIFYATHKEILTELLRVSKIVLYNFQLVTGSKSAFLRLLGDFNEYVKDIVVWQKSPVQPAMKPMVLSSAHEFIVILEADKRAGRSITNSYFERGALSNLWAVNSKKQESQDHGAAFPLTLAKKAVHFFSSPGDLVYDPFGGTGTTAVAAHELGRNWILSDIIPSHCRIAEARLLPCLTQTRLFH